MPQLTDEDLAQWAEQAKRDDWHCRFVGSDIRQLIGEVQRLRAERATLFDASKPKPWIDETGALRAPEGYHFASVEVPGVFDASGYPSKALKLAPNMTSIAGGA